MTNTCDVVTVEHTETRQVARFGVCGKPATHRLTSGTDVWFSCIDHAQHQGTFEPLEKRDGEGMGGLLLAVCMCLFLWLTLGAVLATRTMTVGKLL